MIALFQDHLTEKENELLTSLRAIVSGEKQEYYTDEMFQVFYEHAMPIETEKEWKIIEIILEELQAGIKGENE